MNLFVYLVIHVFSLRKIKVHIRIYLVLLVLVLLMIDTGRADPNLDSLEASLDKATNDTSKLTALADLAWYYRNIKPSKAIYFAFEGLEIADKYKIIKYSTTHSKNPRQRNTTKIEPMPARCTISESINPA